MIEPAAGDASVPQAAFNGWSIHGVRLSRRIMPAAQGRHGGDWCEAFVISDNILALSIGDVSGHGEGRYGAMAATRQAIRDAACSGLDPAQTLAEGHRFLSGFDPDLHATAVFGLLDVGARRLVFANAGHPPPLLVRASDALYLEYPDSDLPLGVETDYLPLLREAHVPAEALLVFYTDGVTERERKPLEGALELRDAAIFATRYSHLPTAAVIERQLFLTASNIDDAAILAAWTPAGPRRFANARGRKF